MSEKKKTKRRGRAGRAIKKWIKRLIILILLAATLASTLVILLCITIASVITRKHKIITAIAIYYGFNFITTGVTQILLADGNVYTVFYRFVDMGEETLKIALALVGLIGLGVCVLAATGLYMLEAYLLDRKLNLE